MRTFWAFALALSLLFAGKPVLALPFADVPVSLQVTLSPTSVRLGDPVLLRLAVAHPAQTKLSFPETAALQSTGLEVLHILPGQNPHAFDDSVTTVMEYTIVGFSPHIYVIPPALLRVGYETQDGQRGVVGPPDSLTLVVGSVLTGSTDPSLREIRPPVALAEPPVFLANPLAPTALALAALLLLLIYLRTMRRPIPISLGLTPEQQAREALQTAAALLSGPVPSYRQFYTLLAEVVRVYLAQRTGLPTLTSTTRELRRRLEQNGADRQQSTLILRLLEECDRAKWAHEYPGPDAADRALALAYQIVDTFALEKATAEAPPPLTPSLAGGR